MSRNQVCGWDFTLKAEGVEVDELKEELKRLCKKWVFQLEKGASGYMHFQGRVSLKVKSRLPDKKWCFAWSVTSKTNCSNDFYVTKEDTRVDGPWRDDDVYVPRQIREIGELWPWQIDVVKKCQMWEPRIVNVIVNPDGCEGKSILVGKIQCELKIGRRIPPLANYKELMGMVMCMPESGCYLIDIPRALDKSKQEEFYSAIENIKDGYCFDNRYTFKEKWFDSPSVWVFSNEKPNLRLLSKDRWRLWEIDEERELRALRCNTKP